MTEELIPKGWAICEWRNPPFKCSGCGKGGFVSGWKQLDSGNYCCDRCGPTPDKPVRVPKVVQNVARASEPLKRRGRPPGSKNRAKK